MQILIAQTEDFIFTERTNFSADEAVGQTVLSCDNCQGFAADDYVCLGTVGDELAEIGQVSSVSADLKTITLTTAIKHAHKKRELIQLVLFNQRKFYRSTTETGTFSHLSGEGSPKTLEVDRPDGTLLEDTSGTSTSWYKATYNNTTTGVETSLTDAIAIKASEANHYTSINKIKTEAGMEENYYIPIEMVNDYRLEAENQAESTVAGVYSLPFSSIPPIFEQIVRLLAAGLLLSKEFGVEMDAEINKTGKSKIARAERQLSKIVDGSMLLIGEDGSILTKASTILASSSNVYNETDKGEMFNVGDEIWRTKDPDYPTS